MVALQYLPLTEPPPLGHAVPKDAHHAVSVQMTTWEDMQGLMLRTERILAVQKIGYPRSFLHPDIAKVRVMECSRDASGDANRPRCTS